MPLTMFFKNLRNWSKWGLQKKWLVGGRNCSSLARQRLVDLSLLTNSTCNVKCNQCGDAFSNVMTLMKHVERIGGSFFLEGGNVWSINSPGYFAISLYTIHCTHKIVHCNNVVCSLINSFGYFAISLTVHCWIMWNVVLCCVVYSEAKCNVGPIAACIMCNVVWCGV